MFDPDDPYGFQRKPSKAYHQRNYGPVRDMNETNRMLIGGAVTIGTLGLIGSLFRRN